MVLNSGIEWYRIKSDFKDGTWTPNPFCDGNYVRFTWSSWSSFSGFEVYAELKHLQGAERSMKFTFYDAETDYYSYPQENTIKFDPKMMKVGVRKFSRNTKLLRLIVSVEDVTSKAQDKLLPYKSDFIDAFDRLRTDDDTKDITFIFESGTIKAHSLILAARSPVFKKMFETDMKEKSTNTIEIKDVSAEVFDSFLKFIYTDQHDAAIASDLLYLGEKYGIEDLRARSANKLVEQLSVQNAIDTLIIFDRFRIVQLAREAAKFIAMNKSKMYQDEARAALTESHPHLADMIDFAYQMVQ